MFSNKIEWFTQDNLWFILTNFSMLVMSGTLAIISLTFLNSPIFKRFSEQINVVKAIRNNSIFIFIVCFIAILNERPDSSIFYILSIALFPGWILCLFLKMFIRMHNVSLDKRNEDISIFK